MSAVGSSTAGVEDAGPITFGRKARRSGCGAGLGSKCVTVASSRGLRFGLRFGLRLSRFGDRSRLPSVAPARRPNDPIAGFGVEPSELCSESVNVPAASKLLDSAGAVATVL